MPGLAARISILCIFFNQDRGACDSLVVSVAISSINWDPVRWPGIGQVITGLFVPERRKETNRNLRGPGASGKKTREKDTAFSIPCMSESTSTTSSEETVSLEKLRQNCGDSWERAYRELWRVGWIAAKRKLPYDSKEQLEDLLSQVIGNEIVPQLINPTREAFVKAMTFDDILNLTSRILGNRAIDEIRKRTRRPDSSDIDRVPESEVAAKTDDGAKGRAEELMLALSQLDDRYRVILEDFYFEDLSTEEISRRRGRPKGTICSDLVKARKLVGTLLTESGGQEFNQVQA